MQKQEHQIPIGQRVRLKSNGPDTLYEHANAGTEGWIRRRMHDEFGYPMVYIEWDRDHWADNGEQDRWALEAHFEPVEEKQMGDGEYGGAEWARRPPTPEEWERFLRWRASEGAPTSEERQEEAFNDALSTALEDAAESEGFLLITAHKREAPHGGMVWVPNILRFYKSEAVGLAISTQVAELVARTHEVLANSLIAQIQRREGK